MEGTAAHDSTAANRSIGPAPLFHWRCERPLLVASFERPQAALSWAMARPGFQTISRVAWLEVSRADLTLEVDPYSLLADSIARADLTDAVAMMTSRDVRSARSAEARSGVVAAQCLATVGLNNAVRAGGSAATERRGFGTINLLAAVSAPLAQPALVEALSIAAEARTAAVMDLNWLVDGAVATGTGTDCIVVAAPDEAGGAPFAGLHTDVGVAIAASVYAAVAQAGREWIAERGRPA